VKKLQLSLGVTEGVRTRPIIKGDLRADGMEFITTVTDPGDLFWRQLNFDEFDVSEMSMSSLLMLLGRGDPRWGALPIFTSREFFHVQPVVRADSGITGPQDLRGKRVGVTEYQQTAAVWTRGALEHEFGVRPEEMIWSMERNPSLSHGGAVGFESPPGVRLQYIPEDRSVASMLLVGEIDATIRYSVYPKSLVNRGHVELRGQRGIRTLFPDPMTEGVRYYKKTGIFPMSHCVVVRRTLLEQYPWIALNIYNVFLEAHKQAVSEARSAAEPYARIGLLSGECLSAFDHDPMPYGVARNRVALETLAIYSHEQGLTRRVLPLEEIFVRQVLAL
jgi:4,5-dihydroxyphthalate decarboxylase